MTWALVNTFEVPLIIRTLVQGVTSQEWQEETISAVVGTICNIIAYDGVSPYTAPENYKLRQVPNSAKIGDTGY